jgi:hypothetical protein
MEVAVFTSRDLAGIYIKNGFRGFTWIEKLPVCLPVSNNLNPLNIMFFFHGMSDLTHFDLNAGINLLDNGTCFSFAASTVFSTSLAIA